MNARRRRLVWTARAFGAAAVLAVLTALTLDGNGHTWAVWPALAVALVATAAMWRAADLIEAGQGR